MREATHPVEPAGSVPLGVERPGLAVVDRWPPVREAPEWVPWVLLVQVVVLLFVGVVLAYQLLASAIADVRPWPVAAGPAEVAVRFTLRLFLPSALLVGAAIALHRRPAWWTAGVGPRAWGLAGVAASAWTTWIGVSLLGSPGSANGTGLTRPVALLLIAAGAGAVAGILRPARHG